MPKLNLGCGQHLLAGWINIDGRDYGQEQVCDLRALPFADDSCDLAQAIHVIEHFYLWEVPGVLAEWRRVLKPEGALILELPNLLRVIDYWTQGVSDERLTYWPLYGDPSHREPAMCHRWAWTPETLGDMLKGCGYGGIRQEPARHHLPSRDMRLVAHKRREPCS